jgi:hypothetical protein
MTQLENVVILGTIVVKENYRASHILRQVTLSSSEKQSSCDSSCDSARGVELELSGRTVPTRCLISTRKQKERVLQRKKKLRTNLMTQLMTSDVKPTTSSLNVIQLTSNS